MKRPLAALVLSAALFGLASPAFPAEQTVTLSVGLWCPSCTYIVTRTLQGVDGVLDVRVSYEDQVAVVRFDDETTDVTALTEATASVGFPSEPAARQ